jgi:branched-chain amino acid transport system ATP-binding protein
LNALSGLVRPARGSVRFGGQELVGRPGYAIARAGLVQVPEGRQVLAPLTVLDNLELGAYARSDRTAVKHDLEHVLTLFPVLRERLRQLAGTLSGGEQQMLAFGRALMAKPRLLLLDEPSMGLAPVIVDQVFAAVSQMNEAGIGVLIVEQNARQALDIASYGYVMEVGQLVLDGPAAALREDPRVQEAYLGSSPASAAVQGDPS